MHKLKVQIEEQTEQIAQKEAEILSLKEAIKQAQSENRELAKLGRKDASLEKQKALLEKKQEQLEKKRKKLAHKQAKLANKRRHGDRKDGKLIRDIDAMHYIMPLLYPNRCDNEAFISDVIDLTNLNAYIDEYNKTHDGARLSPFAVIVAAVLKTITIRDRMNRFIVNGKTYQRNEVSCSFVVKKHFNDDGEEGLAFIHATNDDTLDTIFSKMTAQMEGIRSGAIVDDSSDAMEFFTKKLPGWFSRFLVKCICVLDRHGMVPQSLIETDPYYSSAVLTYVGSIKLQSGYHHLTNWGTNSFFLSVGEKKLRPFYDRHGEMTMKDSIDIALTIDERLADGYYYGKTVRLLKKLIDDPSLLELPLNEPVKY